MRRAALLALVVSACAPRDEVREASTREAFTSAAAQLYDFSFDGMLVTSDAAAADRLVRAQIMFSVGQLNGDSSVGRVDGASVAISGVVTLPTTPPSYEVHYTATLPVAWGGGAAPSSYALVLPKRVDASDQTAFASKYQGACTDPEGGLVSAGDMFLFYRPSQAGCSLDPADVVVANATVSVSTSNTTTAYPEYQRVWEDGELDIVAMFGRELPDGRSGDEGVAAYDAFVRNMRDRLHAKEESDASIGERNVRLTASVGGRRIRIDVLSTGPSLRADPYVDAWYDARSAAADAIIYSGHAGLGDNVRALMAMGEFRPRKYVVMVVNGCDTFAYVDDTLAKRRAELNPDDPSGTRWMDTVTNVLGAYFHSGDATAADLSLAFVAAAEGTPKTYRQIFDTVDPTQLVVVDGEEDNEFEPGVLPRSTESDSRVTTTSRPSPPGGTIAGGGMVRCELGRERQPLFGAHALGTLVMLLMCVGRRRRGAEGAPP